MSQAKGAGTSGLLDPCLWKAESTATYPIDRHHYRASHGIVSIQSKDLQNILNRPFRRSAARGDLPKPRGMSLNIGLNRHCRSGYALHRPIPPPDGAPCSLAGLNLSAPGVNKRCRPTSIKMPPTEPHAERTAPTPIGRNIRRGGTFCQRNRTTNRRNRPC